MEKKKLIHQILQLVLLINQSEEYSAWFRFHGHVDEIQVYIKPKGVKNSDPVYEGSFYTDRESFAPSKAKAIIKTLEQYLIEVPQLNGGK